MNVKQSLGTVGLILIGWWLGEHNSLMPFEAKKLRDLKRGLRHSKAALKVQGTDGNWDVDEYMRGMYNGMAFANHVIEDKKGMPPYRDAPKKYRRNFTSDLPRFTATLSLKCPTCRADEEDQQTTMGV